jgi:hypothetical protein
MRNFYLLVILFICVCLIQVFLSWWTLIFPCILIGFLIPIKAISAFLTGFFTIFLCWFVSYILLEYNSNGIISDKIAQIFFLPNEFFLFFLSSFIGGIVGGTATLVGFYLMEFKRDFVWNN